MKVRAHLAWMALAILIPFAAFAVVGLLQLLKEEEDSAQRSVRETSRAIAQAVDRELENAETLLRVLATSVHLAKGDLPNFYQQAVQASFHEDAWVLLFDRDGNQLINTRVPFGTPLARRTNPERVTEVMRTQRSSVSDLYQAALLRKPVVAVDVPVPLDGGQRYVLTQIFPAEFFDRTFAQRDLPRDWIVAIRDGAGIAIARSHRASEFVGKLGDPKVRE
ncbi:MAG: integral rane sensor hybrid histidine kinase, partial [Betaproteobacteria bacterium]|nr:integral rane sensor hybrid histidine kinase [Betaproteobacteria bacterium]